MDSTRNPTERLLEHWNASSDHEREEGERWYREARGAAVAIAEGTDVDERTAAGVIAALSPRMRWNQNIRAAQRACAREPYGALGTSKRAAARILAGEDPTTVLQGPKVRAFFGNIMGDLDAVTVDVWMLRAMGEPDGSSPTRKRYLHLADAVRTAAAVVGVAPAILQAAVWIHVRGAAA
jgi:hypothetical protein